MEDEEGQKFQNGGDVQCLWPIFDYLGSLQSILKLDFMFNYINFLHDLELVN